MGDFGKNLFALILGDRGPLPVVEEKDSETAWSLWDEAVSAAEAERQLRIQRIRAPGVLGGQLRSLPANS
jgi:hypothetical protein